MVGASRGYLQAGLAARRFVQVLPRLPVVSVETVARFRTGGIEGGDGVAVRGCSMSIMFGTSVSRMENEDLINNRILILT